MKRTILALVAYALLLGIVGQAKAGVVFDFEGVALGTSTSFSDTKDGITATFSSPADPGGFMIVASPFAPPISGHILLDPGPSGKDSIPLGVTFSQALSSVSLDFVTDGPGEFQLSAFLGSTFVGSATATGSVPIGFFFPQGDISFSGGPFDNIVLQSPATPFFAVDNFDVNPASVPEPATVTLLAIGIAGMAGYGWRRQKQRAAA